jgi:hypothetical protein
MHSKMARGQPPPPIGRGAAYTYVDASVCVCVCVFEGGRRGRLGPVLLIAIPGCRGNAD